MVLKKVISYVLKEEVTCSELVQGLDDVDGAGTGVDNADAWGIVAGQERCRSASPSNQKRSSVLREI